MVLARSRAEDDTRRRVRLVLIVVDVEADLADGDLLDEVDREIVRLCAVGSGCYDQPPAESIALGGFGGGEEDREHWEDILPKLPEIVASKLLYTAVLLVSAHGKLSEIRNLL